jgi:hypothetical protein
MAGEIILFDQNDRKAPARCIARNSGAVDAASDDQQVHVHSSEE